LKKDQVDFIEIKVKNSIILGAEDEVLFGEHLRGAILQIRGDYGIYPAYAIDTNTGKKRAEFFEFHETLVENRHRILAAKLVKDKAVKLYEGCDEEYLYEALSETTDRHFYETLKQLGKDLSIYQIDFDENGDFKVIDLTNISS